MIQGTCENKILDIHLEGHVDSNNAPIIEKEIDELYENNQPESVVIDCSKLDYISSAGLRVLLRLQKKAKFLKLINVSSAVYEVFEMMGFTEIINIEKAYRELSVEGCEVIGAGANGTVYRLDPETIIKVYSNINSLSDIQNERELARKAFVLGIPTAIPYDIVKVGDKFGSVFELLNAQSISKLIAKDPENIHKYIKMYIDLLKKIHSTIVKPGELPNMNDIAKGWVVDLKGKLPQNEWDKLALLINSVPDNYHMLHGDYHTKNVMLQNNELLLIDMDTLCCGDPVYEFAFMFNAFYGYEETLPKEQVGRFLGLNYEQVHALWNESLKLYFNTEDSAILDNISHKAQIIGYTRILRRT